MKIYTKTGDKGQTSLASGERVSKTDLRIEAYGTSDELNSFLGLLRASINEAEIDAQLGWIQNRLFDIGATLAAAPIPITEESIRQLEGWIDTMQEQMEPLKAFILPAGNQSVSLAHVCRTITRRLERCCLRIEDAHPQIEQELIFLNRLSDYLFVLARYIGQKNGIKPTIWQKQ